MNAAAPAGRACGGRDDRLARVSGQLDGGSGGSRHLWTAAATRGEDVGKAHRHPDWRGPFLDEGTDKVLDTLAEIGAIDTLFLATFTYGRGIGGRQPRGSPLPDHGKEEYDDNYHGGNFDTPHPQYYRGTTSRRRRLRIIRAMTSSPTCCRARRSAG